MQTDQDIIKQFSPHLFWDVKRENLGLEKSKKYIIQRALEYGLLKDWLLIKKVYGLEEITSTAMNLRTLDDISLNFISTLSGVPKEKFRCYTLRPLQEKHWIY
ncbi:MAG: DUF6922 domain-containing protein [Bacteroidota bacterium]